MTKNKRFAYSHVQIFLILCTSSTSHLKNWLTELFEVWFKMFVKPSDTIVEVVLPQEITSLSSVEGTEIMGQRISPSSCAERPFASAELSWHCPLCSS